MKTTTRREFLLATTLAGAALAIDRAPAQAQKREISFLSVNHFVPTSDDELRRQAELFGKQTGITVKIDTIMGLQLPAKRAAEAQSQAGHDLVFMSNAFVPVDAMPAWMAVVARLNPLTYAIEAMRILVLDGWRVGVVTSLGVLLLFAAASLTVGTYEFRRHTGQRVDERR